MKMVDYEQYLFREEKSSATVEKYVWDAKGFVRWMECRELSKELVLGYKA